MWSSERSLPENSGTRPWRGTPMHSADVFRRIRILIVGAALLSGPALSAQTPAAPMERITFEEAVRRALDNSPTVAQAATTILRAEGLLQQARAATLPNAIAVFSPSTLDTGRSFDGTV